MFFLHERIPELTGSGLGQWLCDAIKPRFAVFPPGHPWLPLHGIRLVTLLSYSYSYSRQKRRKRKEQTASDDLFYRVLANGPPRNFHFFISLARKLRHGHLLQGNNNKKFFCVYFLVFQRCHNKILQTEKKYYRLDDLNNRTLFSHNSGGQKSKIKESAVLVSSEVSFGLQIATFSLS